MTSDHKLESIRLYYRGTSDWHMDGDAVWVGENSTVVVRRFVRQKRPPSREQVFRFKLEKKELLSRLASLCALDWNRVKVVDRTGVPDEVRDLIVIRSPSGALHSFNLWSDDWRLQGAELKSAIDLVHDIVHESDHYKPVISRPLKRSSDSYWPEEFAREQAIR